jgi:hypothetical protein
MSVLLLPDGNVLEKLMLWVCIPLMARCTTWYVNAETLPLATKATEYQPMKGKANARVYSLFMVCTGVKPDKIPDTCILLVWVSDYRLTPS